MMMDKHSKFCSRQQAAEEEAMYTYTPIRYRTNNIRWKLTHVLVILAHVGLILAGVMAYIFYLGNDVRIVNLGKVAAVKSMGLLQSPPQSSPCGTNEGGVVSLSMMTTADGNSAFGILDPQFEMASRILPISCIILGTLGMVINVGLFMALLAADKTDYSLTESEQHWRKQVVTFFGCLFNLIMTCAGTSLAGTMAARTADSRLLIAPLLWASIQVPLSLTTAVSDAIKNYREGKDLLD